jgi:hypothetical protein
MDDGTKTSVLSVFPFRALLNFGMLLTDSEPARLLRSRLLDIVLDVMAERVAGHTKFINQRDENYLLAAIQEENYRSLGCRQCYRQRPTTPSYQLYSLRR